MFVSVPVLGSNLEIENIKLHREGGEICVFRPRTGDQFRNPVSPTADRYCIKTARTGGEENLIEH